MHATVRNVSNELKYAFLYDVSVGVTRDNGRLRFFQADLTSPDGWDAAMTDAKCVLHLACPVNLNSKNPRRDLIDPVLLGIRHIFAAARESCTVRRIILTSSCAAVSDDFADFKTKTYTAFDWNTKSSLNFNAYAFAKTLEEKAVCLSALI